jgi:DNA-binding NarL/FixJ family response regulator
MRAGRPHGYRLPVTRPRLVLAEDHAPMAQQLRDLLTACCDVVGSVEDGSSLIAAVETLVPDVIVSDIAMPVMSGLAAARIIIARHPSVRIVFVTIRDEPHIVRAALDCGGRGYVLKGDAGDELINAVRAVLAGERYVSASVTLSTPSNTGGP